MKIAILVTHAGVPMTLGTTSFIAALAEGLIANGHNAHVIGMNRSGSAWRPESLGDVPTHAPWIDPPVARGRDRFEAARIGISVPKEAQHQGNGQWYYELLLDRCLASIAEGEPLTVIMHPRSYALLSAVAGSASRRGWRLIVLSNEALTDLQIDPAQREQYTALVADSASGLWAVSRYLRDFWLDRAVPAERIFIQPGIVSARAFCAPSRVEPGTALYMGNLAHREIDALIGLSEKVAASVPDYRLTIYGDATSERRQELSETITARGLSGVIEVREAVRGDEVFRVIAGSALLLLPRSSGTFSAAGFPQKLGEYLASGRPVVVTRVGDIGEYVEDKKSAYLVKPDDDDAFAAAVIDALADSAQSDAIGLQGRRVAEDLLRSKPATARLATFFAGLPQPQAEWGVARGSFAVVRRLVVEVYVGLRTLGSRTWRRLTHVRSGQTRMTAAKIAIVRLLHLLHLRKPPSAK